MGRVSAGKLMVMCQMTHPPNPIGFDVLVADHTVATLTWHDVEKAYNQYKALQEAATKKG